MMDCCGGKDGRHYPSCGSLAAAAQADADVLRPLLASIDNALRTGSYMTNANLALEYLCLRLGTDREALTFDPLWPQRYPDPPEPQCICRIPAVPDLACPVHGVRTMEGRQQ